MNVVVASRVAVVLAVGVTACAIVPPEGAGERAVGTTAPKLHGSAVASQNPPTAVTGTAAPTEFPDVWSEEPPLGPVPEGFTPHAETSRDAVVGYLEAAHTVDAEDAQVRHRRHHPWMHPAAPGRTGGLWTPDPPDAGVTRRVEILEMELVASADHGAAWQATYRLWDGPTLHAQRTRHVATRQVDDGRWLVMAETVDLQPVAH